MSGRPRSPVAQYPAAGAAHRAAYERALDADLNRTEWRVFGALLAAIPSYSKTYEYLWTDEIARRARLHRRTVEKTIAALVRRGVIGQRHRRGSHRPPLFDLAGTVVPLRSYAPRRPGAHTPPVGRMTAHAHTPPGGRGSYAPRTPGNRERTEKEPLSGRGRVRTEGTANTANPPSAADDPLRNALIDALGYPPATPAEQAKWDHALGQLRAARATPEEVRRRARRYVQLHPTWKVTPMALAAWWGSLAARRSPLGLAAARRSARTRGTPGHR